MLKLSSIRRYVCSLSFFFSLEWGLFSNLYMRCVQNVSRLGDENDNETRIFFQHSHLCIQRIWGKVMLCSVGLQHRNERVTFHSHYYVHISANTLGKSMNPSSPQLCVKWYHYSSRRIDLALTNPRSLE